LARTLAAVGRGSSCFAAGTKLLTPDGYKSIETFSVGDWLLSTRDNDAEAPVEPKQIDSVFSTLAPIYRLEVDGRVIRTTAAHPFYVRGKGWREAQYLKPGDLLRSHTGIWSAVDAVGDTGEWQKVYNLSVADYHTYFVADDGWGFSVWAHNACGYQSVVKNIVKYVGIADQGATSTLSQRLAAASARTPAATTAVISGTNGLTALEAQQIEQALIHYYGRQGIEAGGTLLNIKAGLNVSAANIGTGYSLLSKIRYWGTQFLIHSGGSGI
jgi:hypothetical protein